MAVLIPTIKINTTDLEFHNVVKDYAVIRTKGIVGGIGDFLTYKVTREELQSFILEDLTGKFLSEVFENKSHKTIALAIAKKDIEKQITEIYTK